MKLAEAYVEITTRMGKFHAGLRRAEGSLRGFTKRAGAWLNRSRLAFLALGAAVVYFAKKAAEAVESENLFAVSMDKMAAKARMWSEELSRSLGLNAYEIRRQVGMLHVMLKSMGLIEQQAYDMATSVVELSQDMASFYDLKPELAFEKVRSGLVGMTRPLRDLGIVILKAQMEEYAYRTGIVELGEELTEVQKVMARYGALMEQTTAAQGDLARTLSSPVNMMRILRSRMDQISVEIGMTLLPAMKDLMETLNDLATAFSKTFKDYRALFGEYDPAMSGFMGPRKRLLELAEELDTIRKIKDEYMKIGHFNFQAARRWRGTQDQGPWEKYAGGIGGKPTTAWVVALTRRHATLRRMYDKIWKDLHPEAEKAGDKGGIGYAKRFIDAIKSIPGTLKAKWPAIRKGLKLYGYEGQREQALKIAELMAQLSGDEWGYKKWLIDEEFNYRKMKGEENLDLLKAEHRLAMENLRKEYAERNKQARYIMTTGWWYWKQFFEPQGDFGATTPSRRAKARAGKAYPGQISPPAIPGLVRGGRSDSRNLELIEQHTKDVAKVLKRYGMEARAG